MLRYSPRALPAIVKIFENFNDLNLFVENTTSENVYKVFFQKLLPENTRVAKIFQCEGRLGVISAASQKRYKQLKNSFFMIDGDLYILTGEKYNVPKNVFTLNMYCIENGLVCLKTAEDVAFEAEPKLSRAELEASLKIEAWFSGVVNKLTPLFIWYAVAMHFGAQITTSSRSGLSFLKPNSSLLDSEKIKTRIHEIRTALQVEHGKQPVAAVLRSINKRARNQTDLANLISAKTYLLPLIGRHLRKRTAFTDEKALPIRLCHRCDVSHLSGLRAALQCAIQ